MKKFISVILIVCLSFLFVVPAFGEDATPTDLVSKKMLSSPLKVTSVNTGFAMYSSTATNVLRTWSVTNGYAYYVCLADPRQGSLPASSCVNLDYDVLRSMYNNIQQAGFDEVGFYFNSYDNSYYLSWTESGVFRGVVSNGQGMPYRSTRQYRVLGFAGIDSYKHTDRPYNTSSVDGYSGDLLISSQSWTNIYNQLRNGVSIMFVTLPVSFTTMSLARVVGLEMVVLVLIVLVLFQR